MYSVPRIATKVQPKVKMFIFYHRYFLVYEFSEAPLLFKIGTFPSRLTSSRDSEFSVKIGTVPPKSGRLDTLYLDQGNIFDTVLCKDDTIRLNGRNKPCWVTMVSSTSYRVDNVLLCQHFGLPTRVILFNQCLDMWAMLSPNES